jgi:hypothetical protein
MANDTHQCNVLLPVGLYPNQEAPKLTADGAINADMTVVIICGAHHRHMAPPFR